MAKRRTKSADRPAVQPAEEEPAEGQITEEIHVSPESVELFIKLKGDVASVRNTILAAFRESCFDGFQTLAAACLLVDNVTLCKNLLVALTELGQCGEFRIPALTQLMTVVAYGSSAEVREAAAQAIATLQRKSRGFDFLAGPQFTKSTLKRVCALIERATTVKQRQDDGHPEPSPPVVKATPAVPTTVS